MPETYSFSIPRQFGAEHYVVSYTHQQPSQFVVYSNGTVADISAYEEARLYAAAYTVHLAREMVDLGDISERLESVASNTIGIVGGEFILDGLATALSTALSLPVNPFSLPDAAASLLESALETGPDVALWCAGRMFAELAVSKAQTLFSSFLPSGEIDISKIPEAWALAVEVFNLTAAAQAMMEQAADIGKTLLESVRDFIEDVTFGIIDIPFTGSAREFVELGRSFYEVAELADDASDLLNYLNSIEPIISTSSFDPTNYLRYVSHFGGETPPTTLPPPSETPPLPVVSTSGDDFADNQHTSAHIVMSSAGYGAAHGVVEQARDTDWFAIDLVAGRSYRIDVLGQSSVGATSFLDDTFFRVRHESAGFDIGGRPNAVPQFSDSSGAAWDDAGIGTDAQGVYVASVTGRYYISVGAGGPDGVWDTAVGEYWLLVTDVTGGTPSNQAPIAAADSFEVAFGQTIQGNVLANNGSGPDRDPDGSLLTVDVISSFHTAAGGTVDLLSNGTFQYIAPASGGGSISDSFNYTLRDGAGGVTTGVVTLHIAGVPGAFTEGNDDRTLPAGGGTWHLLGGNDRVFGSLSDEAIFGGAGNDTLLAGAGNDYLDGGSGADLLRGGAGNDWIVSDGLDSFIFGDEDLGTLPGVDHDTLEFRGTSGGVIVDWFGAGSGTTIEGIEVLIATDFGDQLIGNHSDNLFYGQGGIDLLRGWGGDDTLYGGAGNDQLFGDDGDDQLFGGDGDDVIEAGNGSNPGGRNYVDGGAGNDHIDGGSEDDVLTGGDGDDFIAGDNDPGQFGNDYIIASAGNDRIVGLDGIDTVDFSQAPAGVFGYSVAGWGTSTLEQIEIVIGSPFNDQLEAREGILELHLGAGDDFGLSFLGSILIRGDDGDDRIFGNAAAETFHGGNGNDQLHMSGGNNIGFGDAGDDIIGGGEGDDTFDGGSGNDTINAAGGTNHVEGGDGNDGLTGGGGSDTLIGGNGHDLLLGSAGIDILEGDLGNDTLNGGSGDDVMSGGAGNDVYYIGDAADQIIELANEGTDEARTTRATVTLAANVENLTYQGGGAFSGTGNALHNTITGGAANDGLNGGGGNDTLNGLGGNDTLNGGVGNDIMSGGLGNDIYFIGDAGDVVVELANQGVDEMRTTRAILSLADNVENLTYQGGGNFHGTGNALNNTLTGGAFNDTLNAGAGNDFVNGGSGNDNLIGGDGNDSLNGGVGNDTMTGGLGDDIYYLGDAGDVVIEQAGQGLDEVRTTRASVTLADNVERLTYQGGGNFAGTGNALSNVITGGAFNDTLNGGLGNDTLIGGSGADNFLFNTTLNALTNSDSISGFVVADDTIILENTIFTSLAADGILAAGNFTIGASAADANDFIIYDGATGALYYDADGAGGNAQIQFAQLASGLALTNNDFLVI